MTGWTFPLQMEQPNPAVSTGRSREDKMKIPALRFPYGFFAIVNHSMKNLN
jgi:hypothetical protein